MTALDLNVDRLNKHLQFGTDHDNNKLAGTIQLHLNSSQIFTGDRFRLN
jgi:hypothetical protein